MHPLEEGLIHFLYDKSTATLSGLRKEQDSQRIWGGGRRMSLRANIIVLRLYARSGGVKTRHARRENSSEHVGQSATRRLTCPTKINAVSNSGNGFISMTDSGEIQMTKSDRLVDASLAQAGL